MGGESSSGSAQVRNYRDSCLVFSLFWSYWKQWNHPVSWWHMFEIVSCCDLSLVSSLWKKSTTIRTQQNKPFRAAGGSMAPSDWPTNTMAMAAAARHACLCARPVAVCHRRCPVRAAASLLISVAAATVAAARREHAGQTLRALAPMIPFYVLAPSGPWVILVHNWWRS